MTKCRKVSFLIPAFLIATSALVNAGDHQLRVGMASIDMEPAIGIPLAGYGAKERRLPSFIDWWNKYPQSFFFRPSTGRYDAIRAQTMAIQKDGKTMIFTSLDTIGVDFHLVNDVLDVLAPLQIKRENLFLAGTHTHSGPGTLSRNLLLECVAVDLFKRENYEYIKTRVLESIFTALGRLEPADLFKTKFTTHDLQKQKWRKFNDHYFNTTAYLLLAKNKQDKFLGGIVNYAVHGGALGPDNYLYSSDFPGAIARGLEDELEKRNNGGESYKPVLAFINGAEADVAAKHEKIEGIRLGGAMFVQQAQAALDSGLVPVAPILKSATRKIWFGIPRFPLIVLRKGSEGTDTWRKIDFLIAGLEPMFSYIAEARIGDIVITTWPGEATTSLGYRLQDQMRALGAEDPWFFGLTNDYMAYFTSHSEYLEGAYDSQSSLFTWRGAERVLRAHKRLFLKMESSEK